MNKIIFDRAKLFRLDMNKIKKILYKDTISHDLNKLCTNYQSKDKSEYQSEDRKKMYDKIINLNQNNHLYNDIPHGLPSVVPSDYFIKQTWSLDHFKKPNLPTIIGHVDHKISLIKDNLRLRNEKYLWLMDLPLKMPCSQIKIPIELSQFTDFFKISIEFERLINPDFDKSYAYLCVDQRPVLPNNYQRRPGWHVDSLVTKYTNFKSNNFPIMDTIYLTYDCLATEFNKSVFEFPQNPIFDKDSDEEVSRHFDNTAEMKNIIEYPKYTVLKMDSRCVHRVQINNTSKTIDRTFVKLIFSTEMFNRFGNDHNYLFDYNWSLYPRNIGPNTSTVFDKQYLPSVDLQGLPSVYQKTINDSLQYVEIFPDQLKKLFHKNDSKQSHHCFDNNFHQVNKKNPVKVQPAHEDEILKSNDYGNMEKYNVANIDDYKITNLNDNTQYFLSLKKIHEFYDVSQMVNGVSDSVSIIVPKQNLTTIATRVLKHVRIFTPWHAHQYLRPGDYVVKKKDDIYGIKCDYFEKNYQFV
jgi:hypothetical protein